MAREDTDYNPAIRKEIKADAETGRTFKKWKHRAQGAAAGAGLGTVAGILAGRKIRRSLSAQESVVRFQVAGYDEKGNMKRGVGAYVKRNASSVIGGVGGAALGAAAALHPKARGARGRVAGAGAILGAHIGGTAGQATDWYRYAKAGKKTKKEMSAILGVTELASIGGFQEMLESSMRLKKVHKSHWKSMDPKIKEVEKEKLRLTRAALNDQERASDEYGMGFMRGMLTTDLSMGEAHPGDLPMDPATLKRKKLNAGQTKQQEPLMPQDPLVRIKLKTVNFATDGNGRPHSGSGQFEPEIDGVSSQSIQRAYSPHNRLTGRPPIKTAKKMIDRRMLGSVESILSL